MGGWVAKKMTGENPGGLRQGPAPSLAAHESVSLLARSLTDDSQKTTDNSSSQTNTNFLIVSHLVRNITAPHPAGTPQPTRPVRRPERRERGPAEP